MKLDSSRCELIDNYIIDRSSKIIRQVGRRKDNQDSFIDSFSDGIEKIEIRKKGKDLWPGERKFTIKVKGKEKPVIITVNVNNQIVGYENENLEEIGDYFMEENRALRRIHIPRVKEIGDYFLANNEELEELEIPSVTRVRNGFFAMITKLKRLFAPRLKQMGDNCFNTSIVGESKEDNLTSIDLPALESVGDCCFERTTLKRASFPNLRFIKDNFFGDSDYIEELVLPETQIVGRNFARYANNLERLVLPELIMGGDCFAEGCLNLKYLRLEKVFRLGEDALRNAYSIRRIEMPNLTECGENFLLHVRDLCYASLPKNKRLQRKLARKIRRNRMFHPDLAEEFKKRLTRRELAYLAMTVGVGGEEIEDAKEAMKEAEKTIKKDEEEGKDGEKGKVEDIDGEDVDFSK